MERAKSRITRFLLPGLIVCVLLAALHPLWLTAMANWLVLVDAPQKADIGVVLGGDYYGHRILKAAEMVKAGYVPAMLVSGPAGFYGMHECDLSIPFAVEHGYPAAWFIPVPHEANSTVEEAETIVKELRRRGVRSLLVVTSNYHTRRARNAFRRFAPDIPTRVVGAPAEFFQAGSWWRTRQGRKEVFLEWSKTVATWVGL